MQRMIVEDGPDTEVDGRTVVTQVHAGLIGKEETHGFSTA
jgi:hypothetical protein